MIAILISVLLLVPYAALLLYYRRAWTSIPPFLVRIEKDPDLPFVSVLISARDEEANIGLCLQSMMQQTYPRERFEVIVVDDHSTDQTAEIVIAFGRKAGNIRLVHLDDFVGGTVLNSYKKKAIETGIALSEGELIMTTDADCVVPPDWIFTVASYCKKHESAMIASPVRINMPAHAGWLRRFFYAFQILDFTTLQGITGAALYKEFHYMANGANLAYPKNIFTEVEGFKGVDDLASGDDMFLMEKVRMVKPHKIHYLKSAMSTVSTLPEETLALFLNQRIRWASKSSNYQDYKIKSVLAIVYAVNVWAIILLGMGIYLKSYTLFVSFLIVKIVFELIFLLPVTRFFGQRHLLWWFLPFQPFHILYIILAGWLGRFGSYRWKGRKVK